MKSDIIDGLSQVKLAMGLEAETVVGKRSRVLCVEDKTVYAQIENRLCSSDDNGETWKTVLVELPGEARAISNLHARLGRKGFTSAKTLHDKRLLLIAKGRLCKCEPENGAITGQFSIPRRSGPLHVCEDKEGALYWGEYFRNSERTNVNVYMSDDCGNSWNIISSFKPGAIRHIHGIFCDPFDNRIWVSTGDRDQECGLWITDDQFKTLERAVDGSQRSRALQLLFTEEYVYFGTDTPFEPNRICRLNKRTYAIEDLAEVNGSVYWGCGIDGHLFFSTAVEPSKVNRDKYASVWYSENGVRWDKVTGHRKDLWAPKYFQLAQLYVPPGNNQTGCLFYTPIATERDLTVQRIRLDSLGA